MIRHLYYFSEDYRTVVKASVTLEECLKTITKNYGCRVALLTDFSNHEEYITIECGNARKTVLIF